METTATTTESEPVAVPIQRILVAYDESPEAGRALELAMRLARAFDASLAVVSVVPFRLTRDGEDPWDEEAVHEYELTTARTIVRERSMEAEFLLLTGDIAPTIERAIVDGGFDTLVIGSRGRGLAARVLQGSVSEHVATHTRATVVIVH